MPIVVSTPAQSPNNSFVIRGPNPISSVDMFAATRMYARGRRRGLLRRRVPSVNDLNANLVVYTQLLKFEDANICSTVVSKEISDTERRIALATNTAGVIAAPAALYAAVKTAQAGKGNLPRNASRKLLRKLPEHGAAGKVRGKGNALIHALDAPTSTKAKVAAALAGGSIVALQAANAAGDTIAARAFAEAERNKAKGAKA